MSIAIDFLKWVRENKYYLNSDDKWYSTKNRGDYSQPPPVYNEEELFIIYRKKTARIPFFLSGNFPVYLTPDEFNNLFGDGINVEDERWNFPPHVQYMAIPGIR